MNPNLLNLRYDQSFLRKRDWLKSTAYLAMITALAYFAMRGLAETLIDLLS